QEISVGDDGDQPPAPIDDGQMPDVRRAHGVDGLGDAGLRMDGDERGGHEIPHREMVERRHVRTSSAAPVSRENGGGASTSEAWNAKRRACQRSTPRWKSKIASGTVRAKRIVIAATTQRNAETIPRKKSAIAAGIERSRRRSALCGVGAPASSTSNVMPSS